MPDESSTNDDLLKTIYDLIKRYSLVEKIANYLGQPYDFVISGPTGVGKSRVFARLGDDHVALINAAVSTMKNVPKKIKIDQRTAKFHDTPGQIEFAPERQKVFDTTLGKDQHFGVALVGAYGYHEQPGVIIPPDFNNHEETQTWLEQNRKKEADFFKDVVSKLVRPHKTQVVFTIVNKADIHREEWDAVKAYYEGLEYSEVLRVMRVSHQIVRYCSETKKFWGQDTFAPSMDVVEAQEIRVSVAAMLSQFGK